MGQSTLAKSNKKKTIRCHCCRKKLPLISFTCDCKHVFCIMHKAPHAHNCSHSKKDKIQKILQTNNPKVIQTTLSDRI
uniref:AN1-type domain-containing protein n=1 Tax=viral metagenome TaxID=1070528 RepID=A0A6C0F7B6_9ZZZZ